MSIRRVDRIALDGTTVSVTFGRIQIPLLKKSYGDKLETDTLSEMGSQQIDARTPGTYMTDEAKFSIESVRFRSDLLPLFQQQGFGNEKIPVVITYSHPDLGDDSDLLDLCRFTNVAAATENSNKALEVEITMTTDQIYWGNDRVTINTLDTSQPLQASGF